MNDRHGGSKIHEGNGTDTVGAYGEAMTASSIMDIAGTSCNKFGEEQLKAPKSNFNLFSIGKAIKEAGSLVATKKVWY